MNQSPTTIESIIQNVLRRRADGERIDDEAIINAHPELMPRLGIELKKLQLIAGARDQAAGPARADDETINRSEEMDQEETDAPPAEDLPEMEVPDYELLRFLGRGGFGAVYLGRHRIHGEFSAIKIFSKSRAAELDGVRAYKQRAQTNPHLVPIEHVGELAEAYYYVMPLADDVKPHSAVRSPESYEPKSLAWTLANLPPSSAEAAIEIGCELLEGLSVLHEAGLTHADVKPANILCFGGHWRLGDLGLMGPTEHLAADRGTVRFWPPEGPSDPTADLYALGLTLYLLVTGEELIHLGDFLSGKTDLDRNDTQRRFREVIARACHQDPRQRYFTANAMRDALRRCLLSPPSRLKPKGPWLTAGAAALVLILLTLLFFSGRTEKAPTALAPTAEPPQADAPPAETAQGNRSPPLPEVAAKPPARQPASAAPDPPASPLLPLVEIKPGSFLMGSPGGEVGRNENEGPEHTVQINRPFAIGQFEVTQDQYGQVMGKNPSAHPDPQRPVENVSWFDAVEFCRRLSASEGHRYRLPTEAEWEYVCRAGGTTAFASGAELAPGDAALSGSLGDEGPAPVGSYPPNARNVHDMHGNLWEWCQDRWDKDYYNNAPSTDPAGPTDGSLRMIRGGSWREGTSSARSASRKTMHPSLKRDDVGFRVVREEAGD
ncbi:MAG TPA: bifunctional serine/threonine-protein kinase/formylglycine-generating enzyme family protein [Pirellulales bacterium]|nr:bifunctional serine/threonine-protein kinase/formylglycine-generating enzyme family protein [Pirellulales bacterium]